jgi:hypothetical protein
MVSSLLPGKCFSANQPASHEAVLYGKPRKCNNRLPPPLAAKAGFPPLTTHTENGWELTVA